MSMKAEKAGDMGGVIHCFSYGREIAREYLDMGFFLGIGGVSTFNNAKKLKEVVEYAPLESLVLETDCPYLAPVPNRGKRNSSLNLPYVVDAVSALKGVDRETVTGDMGECIKAVWAELGISCSWRSAPVIPEWGGQGHCFTILNQRLI